MTLITSIITFSKKIKIGKKNVTLDPRHGTLALDTEPSTLDNRQTYSWTTRVWFFNMFQGPDVRLYVMHNSSFI